jgi:pimeloyl-ACP methyl ester carboxylesterase
MTTTTSPSHAGPGSSSRRRQGRTPRLIIGALTAGVLVVLAVVVTFGNQTTADPPAQAGDLYRIGVEDLHLQCQGNGTPTVVLLGGQGSSTITWSDFRERLGPGVRTCAWDYPGVGWSTGAPMMTAARAATALDATLAAAAVPRPVVLIAHSIGGLTVRMFVGQQPQDVSGVVLFDPTVPSFARMFDTQNFQPEWDGTTSAEQVESVTSWPDIPFQILRHDPAVYAEQESGAPTSKPSGPPLKPPTQRWLRTVRSAWWRTPGTTSTATPPPSLSEPSSTSSPNLSGSAPRGRDHMGDGAHAGDPGRPRAPRALRCMPWQLMFLPLQRTRPWRRRPRSRCSTTSSGMRPGCTTRSAMGSGDATASWRRNSSFSDTSVTVLTLGWATSPPRS